MIVTVQRPSTVTEAAAVEHILLYCWKQSLGCKAKAIFETEELQRIPHYHMN